MKRTPSSEFMPRLDKERQDLCVQWQDFALAMAGEFLARSRRLAHHSEDIRSAALLGLVEGARRWQPERGAFSTCVYWGIHCRLQLFERADARAVTLPHRLPWAPSREVSTSARLTRNASDMRTVEDTLLAPDCDITADIDARRLVTSIEPALAARILARRQHAHLPPTRAQRARAVRDARWFMHWHFEDGALASAARKARVTRAAVHVAVGRAGVQFAEIADEIRTEADRPSLR
ncbi:hypothetical protein JGU66_18630 [Myxococcaceae bacterium JPH2]|nr:hypothetical protein [Myxococcaceae bacterium JPH2]